MLFHRLTLFNFQGYRGEATMEFPNPSEGEESVIVVLAPNNTGKTTIIRALRFLFFGESKYERAKSWRLINDQLRIEASEGTVLEAWVEARVELSPGNPVTIRRRLQAKALGEGKAEGARMILESRKSDLGNPNYLEDDGRVQMQINAVVPPSIFGWFYFEGEPAEGNLLHHGAQNVSGPINEIIQVKRWNDGIRSTEEVLLGLNKELAKLGKANKEFQQLQRDKEGLEKLVREKNEEANECSDEIKELSAKEQKITKDLDKFTDSVEEDRKKFAQLSQLKTKLSQRESSLTSLDGEIRELIANSNGLPFLRAAFKKVEQLLDELREQNLLPADVSKGFIERLLRDTECICGRSHDDDAKRHLEEYLKQTLSVRANSDLLALADCLDKKLEGNFQDSSQGFKKTFDGLEAKRAALVSELPIIRNAIEKLVAELEDSEVEKVRELTSELKRVTSRKENLIRKQDAASNSCDLLARRLTEKKAEIKKIVSRSGGGKDVIRIQNSIEIAESLLQALTSGKEAFRRSVHTILQEQVSRYYDGTVHDGSTAVVDRKTLLPSIVKSGHVEQNPGGGMRQVISLAYVVSLADLRRKLNAELQTIGLGGRPLGEQSFFLDSPFSNVDPNYLKAIVSFLPGRAPQLVLLLAKQNWTEAVRNLIEPITSHCYALRLHTNQEIKDETAFDFQFEGKTEHLLDSIPEGEHPFTTFHKLS